LLEELRLDARPDDRQQAPEELIEEDRQIVEEARPEPRPDYQGVRDRVLKSFTTGRGRIAPSAPQYRAAAKALDKFIVELERVDQPDPEPQMELSIEPQIEKNDPPKKRGRPKEKNNNSNVSDKIPNPTSKNWEQTCLDNIDELGAAWNDKKS
jgi:hypothetical protein